MRVRVAAVLMLLAASMRAADFYAAPNGSGVQCSLAQPGPLQFCIDRSLSPVHAGDTLWLRGGTYTGGAWVSTLLGTSASPIRVRQYPGEHVALDGGAITAYVFNILGGYTWFEDFEVMSSSTDRISDNEGPWPTGLALPSAGVTFSAAVPDGAVVGIKLIHLDIHDTQQGLFAGSTVSDLEVYGCKIHDNGWQSPTNLGHGHNVYTQNNLGAKTYDNNLFWGAYGEDMQVYGTDTAFLNRFRLFNNIYLDVLKNSRELTIGGDSPLVDLQATGNLFYRGVNGTPGTSDVYVGYTGSKCDAATFANNFIATITLWGPLCTSPASVSGNTFMANFSGHAQWPGNSYLGLDWYPPPTWGFKQSYPTSGKQVFVKPSTKESGRGWLVVYNWDLSSTITADVSAIGPGPFLITNALTGATLTTSAGPNVTLNSSLAISTPHGAPPTFPLSPRFLVYELLSTSTPPPSPTLTSTATPTVTQTSTRTGTPTPTATNTETPTWTPTASPSSTATPTPSSTPTSTATSTPIPPSATASSTPTPTRTPSFTSTPIPPTATPSATRTPTPTRTNPPPLVCWTITPTRTPTTRMVCVTATATPKGP